MTGPATPCTDSWLGRRHPVVKLGVLAAVSSAALVVLDPVTPAVLYVLALAGVVGASAVPSRTLVVAHVPFVGFALGLLVVNALSRPGTDLLVLGPVRFTEEGVAVGGALAARTLLVGVLAVGFVVSTDPVALMTSLHDDLRLSPRVAYAVLAGHRMLQEMPREWAIIRQAHAVRLPVGRVPRSPRHLARAAFTLLTVSIRKGERVARTLESRGLGLHPRTTWRPHPLTLQDGVLVLVVVGSLVTVLVLSAWSGQLRGPGVLLPGG